MSDMKANVEATSSGFAVCGYEKIEYDFTFLDGAFRIGNAQLSECYSRWRRCLAVMDYNIYSLYGETIHNYFEHYQIKLTIHKTMVGEKAKTMDTMLGIIDAMNDFGIYRKEPVLVVGGGLVTDVAGFACASYRRNTNFIRVPTTVIGLIDASVSIKVAVNYGRYKNRLGAYHAPIHTFLDFTFLRTLPIGQIRNGFAELIKISSCADKKLLIFLISIHEMLKLETPNLHEIMLDRVIAYGHTWSPLHELVPDPPLRHGHAISIDMAYSATLSRVRGLLLPEDHVRLLNLFSRAGLSIDHHQFDEELLDKATTAILRTRDGKLRAAVPISPLGDCVFLNDVTHQDLCEALQVHKTFAGQFPRKGKGLEAFVDSSDTGHDQPNGLAVDTSHEEMISS
ncbi:hypothetical protein J3459_015962 [Metarhizium acridum]|nr:hypothetical protein J3459_015962 [Metarhizium acridum]